MGDEKGSYLRKTRLICQSTVKKTIATLRMLLAPNQTFIPIDASFIQNNPSDQTTHYIVPLVSCWQTSHLRTSLHLSLSPQIYQTGSGQ